MKTTILGLVTLASSAAAEPLRFSASPQLTDIGDRPLEGVVGGRALAVRRVEFSRLPREGTWTILLSSNAQDTSEAFVQTFRRKAPGQAPASAALPPSPQVDIRWDLKGSLAAGERLLQSIDPRASRGNGTASQMTATSFDSEVLNVGYAVEITTWNLMGCERTPGSTGRAGAATGRLIVVYQSARGPSYIRGTFRDARIECPAPSAVRPDGGVTK